MKLTIKMDLDNAAFEVEGRRSERDGHEIARCLEEVAQKLGGVGVGALTRCPIHDINGNTVGTAEVTEE